jgi:hypothetical protein
VRVGADRREGEFSHRRLADDDCAGTAQALDNHGVFGRRRRIAADDRTGQSGLAGNVEQILDGDNVPVEWPQRSTCLDACIGGIGSRARALGVKFGEDALVPGTGIKAREDLFKAVAGGFRHCGF